MALSYASLNILHSIAKNITWLHYRDSGNMLCRHWRNGLAYTVCQGTSLPSQGTCPCLVPVPPLVIALWASCV